MFIPGTASLKYGAHQSHTTSLSRHISLTPLSSSTLRKLTLRSAVLMKILLTRVLTRLQRVQLMPVMACAHRRLLWKSSTSQTIATSSVTKSRISLSHCLMRCTSIQSSVLTGKTSLTTRAALVSPRQCFHHTGEHGSQLTHVATSSSQSLNWVRMLCTATPIPLTCSTTTTTQTSSQPTTREQERKTAFGLTELTHVVASVVQRTTASTMQTKRSI